jgi:monovalent cation/hydrogen antiporter
VLGTLVIQGLTLKALLRALNLADDDPVGREVHLARERALFAALESVARDESQMGEAVRQEFTAHLTRVGTNVCEDGVHATHGELHSGAINAAREAVLAMRANDEIGDDAFHVIEEELDWLEMAGRHSSAH